MVATFKLRFIDTTKLHQHFHCVLPLHKQLYIYLRHHAAGRMFDLSKGNSRKLLSTHRKKEKDPPGETLTCKTLICLNLPQRLDTSIHFHVREKAAEAFPPLAMCDLTRSLRCLIQFVSLKTSTATTVITGLAPVRLFCDVVLVKHGTKLR